MSPCKKHLNEEICMKKVVIISVAIITFLALFVGFSKFDPTKNVQAENTTQTSKIKITEKSRDDNSIIYQIEGEFDDDDPTISIHTDQIKNIDISYLEKELGKANISIDEKSSQIYLNLKTVKKTKPGYTFYLKKLGIDDLKCIIHNNQNKTIYKSPDTSPAEESETNQTSLENEEPNTQNSEANSQETSDNKADEQATTEEISDNKSESQPRDAQEEIARDPDWNQGWTSKNQLEVSKGIPTDLADGGQSVPVQYFGALNYSLEHITVKDSYTGRPLRPGIGIIPGPGLGKGRKNNLTAANSGIIIVPKNGNWQTEQAKKKEKNHYLNFTFGDGLLFGDGTLLNPDAVYRGSQRNFITTNLFDYYQPTGNPSYPRIGGPDVEVDGDTVGLDEHNVKYYTKPLILEKDGKKYHTTMQRVVFRQIHDNNKIQITITQRFDNNNGSIITTEFKNIGSTYLEHFQGYNFRDITFLKDHRRKGSKQDNIIRSLGNHRGAYASRNGDFGARIEFDLNSFPDSPYAWSARGTRSTTFYASKDDHFPWNFKGLFNKYDDAFKDIYDQADKLNEPTFGEPFMTRTLDSGISMHTKDQELNPGQTVSMTYTTNIVKKDEKPDLNIQDQTNFQKPYTVKPNEDSVKIKGNWQYDRHEFVNVQYLVTPLNTLVDDQKNIKPQLLKKGISLTNGFQQQTTKEMYDRTPHDWELNLPIQSLGSGKQKISFIAFDKDGRQSEIQSYYIDIPERGEQALFLGINSPVGKHSKTEPYDPRTNSEFTNALDITGFCFDPTKNYDLTYTIDNGESKTVPISEKEKESNDLVNWKLKDLDVSKYLSDNEIHEIKFILKDKNGNPSSPTSFFFQFKPATESDPNGTIRLDAPEHIYFGTKHLSANSSAKLKPTLSENLVLDDYRKLESRDNPIMITVQTSQFVAKEDENNILNTTLLWDNKKIDEKKPFIFKNTEKKNRIILNDLFKNNVKLKVKSNSPANPGHFKSYWSWTATDSVH